MIIQVRRRVGPEVALLMTIRGINVLTERREQRLKAARPFVEEQKKRHHQVILSQLALVQALASRRALINAGP